MYNRYIPGADGYTRVVMEEGKRQERPRGSGAAHRRQHKPMGLPPFLAGEDKNAGIAGILKSLHLEDLDSGDVLLLLIILFLFLEGDNLEVVITLGLMLLLGLGDEDKAGQKE